MVKQVPYASIVEHSEPSFKDLLDIYRKDEQARLAVDSVAYLVVGKGFYTLADGEVYGDRAKTVVDEFCRGAPCLFRDVYLPRPAKRGHAQPPKPVILIPPFFGRRMDLPAGGRLEVDIVIFGEYVRSFLQLVLGMIAFGQAGIGPDRHYGVNRFEVLDVRCLESGGYVLQNSKIDSEKLAVKDIKDLEPLTGQAVMSFKTPFTGPYPPSTMNDLLRLIRHRLIRLVNEYGSGETILPVEEDTEGTTLSEVHRHTLKRRSIRSEKEFFHGWTGSIAIDLSKLSEKTRWLLACAPITGIGPDSSFGAGFVDIFKPIESIT